MNRETINQQPSVVMLLDNHYAPDPRVELEARILEGTTRVRIVAWNRCCDEDTDPLEESVGSYGEEIIRVCVPTPAGGGIRSIIGALRFSYRAWRKRKSILNDADALVVHDVYLLPVGWLLSRHRSIRLIYDAHEDFALMEAGRYPKVLLRLISGLETRLARRASAIILPGKSRIQRWENCRIDKCIVLPNIGDFTSRPAPQTPKYDLVYCGTLGPTRRLDLLIELARSRPEISISIAGRGRGEEELRSASSVLENLEFRGWVTDTDDYLASGRAVYYGHEPDHPYSSSTCPNTLYQALRVRRPLVFFCGGEPLEALETYPIGIRCDSTVEALGSAIEQIRAGDQVWSFDDAWEALASERVTRDYLEYFRSLERLESV